MPPTRFQSRVADLRALLETDQPFSTIVDQVATILVEYNMCFWAPILLNMLDGSPALRYNVTHTLITYATKDQLDLIAEAQDYLDPYAALDNIASYSKDWANIILAPIRQLAEHAVALLVERYDTTDIRDLSAARIAIATLLSPYAEPGTSAARVILEIGPIVPAVCTAIAEYKLRDGIPALTNLLNKNTRFVELTLAAIDALAVMEEFGNLKTWLYAKLQDAGDQPYFQPILEKVSINGSDLSFIQTIIKARNPHRIQDAIAVLGKLSTPASYALLQEMIAAPIIQSSEYERARVTAYQILLAANQPFDTQFALALLNAKHQSDMYQIEDFITVLAHVADPAGLIFTFNKFFLRGRYANNSYARSLPKTIYNAPLSTERRTLLMREFAVLAQQAYDQGDEDLFAALMDALIQYPHPSTLPILKSIAERKGNRGKLNTAIKASQALLPQSAK